MRRPAFPTILFPYPPNARIPPRRQLPALECHPNLHPGPTVENPPRPCLFPHQHRQMLQHPLCHSANHSRGSLFPLSPIPHARVRGRHRTILRLVDCGNQSTNNPFRLFFILFLVVFIHSTSPYSPSSLSPYESWKLSPTTPHQPPLSS